MQFISQLKRTKFQPHPTLVHFQPSKSWDKKCITIFVSLLIGQVFEISIERTRRLSTKKIKLRGDYLRICTRRSGGYFSLSSNLSTIAQFLCPWRWELHGKSFLPRQTFHFRFPHSLHTHRRCLGRPFYLNVFGRSSVAFDFDPSETR